MINNVIRVDEKFPIGIFDIIEIPKTKEYFRLFQDEHSRFVLHKVSKEEAGIKPSKIINKTRLKKGKTQINLFDLKSNKIRSHLKLEKNVKIYLMEGKYTGHVAVVEDIIQTNNLNPSRLICGYKNKKFETLKKYAFVIGNEITTPE